MIECPNCHDRCDDDEKVCPHCGFSLTSAKPAPKDPNASADQNHSPLPPQGQVFSMFKDGFTSGGATHVNFVDVVDGRRYSCWYKGATDYTLHIKFSNRERVYLADCPNGKVKKVYYAYNSYQDYLADRRSPQYGQTFLSHSGMIFILIFMAILFAVIIGVAIYFMTKH